MPDIAWRPRDGTSDLSIIYSTAIDDEYGLRDLPPLEGWALDVGAHIGSVAIPLALDHPGLQVLAIEALPANVDLLREHVADNGLTGRVMVEGIALTGEDGLTTVMGDYTSGAGLDDLYVRTNRYIGNVIRSANHPEFEGTAYDVEGLTLSSLLDGYGITDVAFTKIDCETCEWSVLADPAVSRLRYIVGEYHDRSEDDLYELLHATHEVTTFPAGEAIGLFMAEVLA